MKINISNKDKILRMVAGCILIVLTIIGVIRMPASILVWIVAIILFATAIAGHCPMYTLFGINTKDKRKFGSQE